MTKLDVFTSCHFNTIWGVNSIQIPIHEMEANSEILNFAQAWNAGTQLSGSWFHRTWAQREAWLRS